MVDAFKAISIIAQLPGYMVTELSLNKIQKSCDKFQKMLCIPSEQTKPSANKPFNVNVTKFTIHQTLIQKWFYSFINTTKNHIVNSCFDTQTNLIFRKILNQMIRNHHYTIKDFTSNPYCCK